MTNKKGFTMIELLGVIVILGILSVMAIVSVTRLITKSKTEQKNSQAKTLMMAAESYMQANKNDLPKTIGEVKKVLFKTTIKQEKENEKNCRTHNWKQ